MTRRFEVILTSFSSDKCNGQFKFKIKWLFITSANELVRAR